MKQEVHPHDVVRALAEHGISCPTIVPTYSQLESMIPKLFMKSPQDAIDILDAMAIARRRSAERN